MPSMRRVLAVALMAVAGFGLAAMYRTYLVSELRKPVLASLGNPKSPVFKNELYVGNWTTEGILCGQVEAGPRTKGFQWYAVANGKVFIENEDIRRQLDDAGIRRCTESAAANDVPWWWLEW